MTTASFDPQTDVILGQDMPPIVQHSCSALRCTEPARWITIERTPFNRKLRHSVGCISVHCDDHVDDAVIADEQTIQGYATTGVVAYTKIARVWPKPARIRRHALDD